MYRRTPQWRVHSSRGCRVILRWNAELFARYLKIPYGSDYTSCCYRCSHFFARRSSSQISTLGEEGAKAEETIATAGRATKQTKEKECFPYSFLWKSMSSYVIMLLFITWILCFPRKSTFPWFCLHRHDYSFCKLLEICSGRNPSKCWSYSGKSFIYDLLCFRILVYPRLEVICSRYSRDNWHWWVLLPKQLLLGTRYAALGVLSDAFSYFCRPWASISNLRNGVVSRTFLYGVDSKFMFIWLAMTLSAVYQLSLFRYTMKIFSYEVSQIHVSRRVSFFRTLLPVYIGVHYFYACTHAQEVKATPMYYFQSTRSYWWK